MATHTRAAVSQFAKLFDKPLFIETISRYFAAVVQRGNGYKSSESISVSPTAQILTRRTDGNCFAVISIALAKIPGPAEP